MAKFDFSFDAKKFQKSLKKEMQKAIKKEQAAASVSMQPEFDGIKILDRACEDALRVILEQYYGNDSLSVSGCYDVFPKYMRFSLGDIFTRLKLSGVIASEINTFEAWNVYLTTNGVTYFDDKKRYEEGLRPMFRKLPTNSKQLLDDILSSDNPTHMLCERFEKCTDKEDDELRSLLRELTEKGYINISWADNVPLFIEINNSARTYNEQEAEYERLLKHTSRTVYNIGTITNQNSIVTFGDIINSTISIDNAVKRIENEIEDKGGEDKEELRALLAEAKELIDNLNSTRHIPKNRGFIKRLSTHLEKHGWFYGEIVGLLGTAALNLLQG
jgi:ribosomal protein S20